jgi:hypothetical protein
MHNTQSKFILYHYRRGIQLAMRMLQGMAGSGYCEDDHGDSISVGMLEVLPSMRKFVTPRSKWGTHTVKGSEKAPRIGWPPMTGGLNCKPQGLPLC